MEWQDRMNAFGDWKDSLSLWGEQVHRIDSDKFPGNSSFWPISFYLVRSFKLFSFNSGIFGFNPTNIHA